MMESKVNPQRTKNHPEFVILLKLIQNERIKEGKETSQSKIALWKLTKTIANMINSNPEIFKTLVEVKINDL